MDDYRVLVVADDPLARTGLAALLANQAGCTVVGQMAARDDLAAALDVYRPVVMVWDLGWPGTERWPEPEEGSPPVVALVADVEGAALAWAAGARGILPRNAHPGRLLAAIVATARGLIVIDPTLPLALPLTSPELPGIELTPREREVLRLLADGLPNKTIARRLDISEHTVKFHLNSILAKLGAQSRTEAVVQAIRHGLIAL